MRLIKKYPNRRLYDTEISSYVTLEDVRQLVLENEPFMVQDTRTKKDITRNILLQIILEQEDDGEPIFSTQLLEHIVRFYGDELQSMMASYLENSLRIFIESQENMRRQMRNVMRGDALAVMREASEQNLAMWRDAQKRFFALTAPPRKPAEDGDAADEPERTKT